MIADGAFYYLDAPVKRMGAMDVPVPFSPVLEDQTVPTPETVAAMAKQLCNKNDEITSFNVPVHGYVRLNVELAT